MENTCDKCGKTLKNASGLRLHKMQAHKIGRPTGGDRTVPEASGAEAISEGDASIPAVAPTASPPADAPKAPGLLAKLGIGTPQNLPTKPPKPDAPATLAEIKADFTVADLAGILTNASEVLSAWDGAGQEGVLSALEAKQMANLLHDAVAKAILRYFGSAEKFKMSLAIGLLLMGKGRVHYKAISAKAKAAKAAKQSKQGQPTIEAVHAREAQERIEQAVEETDTDWIKALAAKQRSGG